MCSAASAAWVLFISPFGVLRFLPSAFAVNGDTAGAAESEEERLTAVASAPAPVSGADSSGAPALPSAGEAREAEEASSSSTAPARAAVPAPDALPPG